MKFGKIFSSIFISFAVCILIFITLNDYGIAWDEPMYFSKGNAYVKWLFNPDISEIEKVWKADSDDIHPPLRKLLSSLFKSVLSDKLHVLDDTRGYRMSAIIYMFAVIFFLNYYLSVNYGFISGIIGILLFLSVPQIYYLANISSLDFPVMVMWFVTLTSMIMIKPSIKQAIITGILTGLSLLTKFNAVFLIPVIMTFMIYTRKNNKIKVIFNDLLLFSICSAFIFFLLWPWLWINPISNLISFIFKQGGHLGPMVWFMGKLYKNGPWYYPFTVFLIATPTTVLLSYFIGFLYSIYKGSIEEKFLFFNSFYPFFLLLVIPAAKYDGIRLFLPVYPYIAIIGAIGIVNLINRIKIMPKSTLYIVTFIILGINIATGVIHSHPFQYTYYNELVGGAKGGKLLGFESEYWGSSYLNILPWMNKNKHNQFCVFPTTNPFYYYLAMGYLEPGVTFNAAPEECDFLIVLLRQGYIYQYPNIVRIVNSQTPEYSILYESVPLVSAYKLTEINTDLFKKLNEHIKE